MACRKRWASTLNCLYSLYSEKNVHFQSKRSCAPQRTQSKPFNTHTEWHGRNTRLYLAVSRLWRKEENTYASILQKIHDGLTYCADKPLEHLRHFNTDTNASWRSLSPLHVSFFFLLFFLCHMSILFLGRPSTVNQRWSVYAQCVWACVGLCVLRKSSSNPIDRDAALIQLSSSCLVWSRGVRGWGGWGWWGGVFMLRPLSLTCATVINRFNHSYFSSVYVSSSSCCYVTLSCPLVMFVPSV